MKRTVTLLIVHADVVRVTNAPYPKDYDTAKLLKEAETQLKSLGQQLAQLEVAKRQAVEDEDYDRAKMLKVLA